MWPKVSQKRAGRLEQLDFRCKNGWICALTTQRFDKPNDEQPNGGDPSASDEELETPPCLLMVDELRTPLLDLLIPPTLAKDDREGSYRAVELDNYVDEFYENQDLHESEVQRLIPEMHQCQGGLP
ncbi:hypothetical protein Rt10032_c16g5765 [Rhodotorula toruloides]|uniref:Uncharacterized protein n=1 Tax=Rhodotorula toruloides TaxID=5286 RepID=A0A511KMY7_RHOTO|nr:hypothetical protein Rt10032_c16g5765 [Rhodotorula toruloides]